MRVQAICPLLHWQVLQLSVALKLEPLGMVQLSLYSLEGST